MAKELKFDPITEKFKFNLHTGLAWLIWAVLITAGYIFTGFKPTAQFGAYALWLTTGTGIYTGKRLLQKRKEFNGK